MSTYIKPQIEVFEVKTEEILSTSQIEVYGRGTSEEPLTRHKGGWDSSQWSNNNEDYWNTY